MKLLSLLIVALLLGTSLAVAAAAPPQQPRLRPYTGIGILLLPVKDTSQDDKLYLYEEPALSRISELHRDKIPSYDWIFGVMSAVKPLVVVARKGDWYRVVYDDAGREAWLQPRRQGLFRTYPQFFKQHVARLLPGLQKKYYQQYQQPGKSPLQLLTPKHSFKIVRIENDWALTLVDQNPLGWLRWRDEDGRLLLGISTPLSVIEP